MGYGIILRVYGDYACFTNQVGERMSYDVITPSAARGILESIYWNSSIRWIVDKIYVINEIQFENIIRNELTCKIPIDVKVIHNINRKFYATQMSTLMLRNVHYIIYAHFIIINDNNGTEGKHFAMFCDRAKKGKCFKQPYFGCREFTAYFELMESCKIPISFYKNQEKYLGSMLNDFDFSNSLNPKPKYFKATMKDGFIMIPSF